MIKAKDVRDHIQSMGFERGVRHTLEIVIENQRDLTNRVRELAQLLDKTIDVLSNIANANAAIMAERDKMKEDTDKVLNMEKAAPDLNDNTYRLGDEQ